MELPTKKFLIVEDDGKYALWVRHAVASGWPADTIVIMDWTSFARVRTAMTVRDYDIVMLALKFDEAIEEPTTDGFDWIRKLRSQPGFPEMIILAEGGSELAAIRTLRLGAADYLPKRLITPQRLQRSIKLTLRAIDKQAQRRTEQLASTAAVATQTGATLARAAKVALAAVPTPEPVTEPVAPDPAAVSLPVAVKEAKPVAPPNHQIPGYTILQKIGESEA